MLSTNGVGFVLVVMPGTQRSPAESKQFGVMLWCLGVDVSYGPLRPPWTCMGMIFGTRAQPSPMSSKFSDDFRKMDPCKSKVNLK